jgi:hypothetical protein
MLYRMLYACRHYKIAIEIYQKNLEATGAALNQSPAVMQQPIVMQAPLASVGYMTQQMVMNPNAAHMHPHMPLQMHQAQQQQHHGMVPPMQMLVGGPTGMGMQPMVGGPGMLQPQSIMPGMVSSSSSSTGGGGGPPVMMMMHAGIGNGATPAAFYHQQQPGRF